MLRIWNWASRWLPVIAMCALVYTASGDEFSFPRSSRILGPLVKWFWPGVPDDTLHFIVVAVRKAAHVTEYAVLAVFLWRAVGGFGRSFRGWSWGRAGFCLGFVVVYAASDELHQALVPGRQGSVWDVAWDSLGGFLGVALVWVWAKWRRKTDRAATEVGEAVGRSV